MKTWNLSDYLIYPLNRIREQRNAVQASEKRYTLAQQQLKETRALLGSAGPDVLFGKMEEDCKMNKYLATENLPKVSLI